MTDQPAPRSDTTEGTTGATAVSRRARVAASARVPAKKRRRHPARGARIAAAGIGATTMLGLVGAMASTRPSPPPPDPVPPAPVVVIVQHADPYAVTDPSADAAETTMLEVRPTIRPAPMTSRSPAARTSGSR